MLACTTPGTLCPQLLQKENSRLLSYMGLDSDSVLPQVPASSWEGAPQKPVLIYGNPYSGERPHLRPSMPVPLRFLFLFRFQKMLVKCSAIDRTAGHTWRSREKQGPAAMLPEQ